MAGNEQDKYEVLKRQHAEAIESLRALYEENPELEAEAPQGLPELVRSRDEADEPLLEPPSADAVSTDDAAMESSAAAEVPPQRDHLADDGEPFLSPEARVFLRENRERAARKRRLGKEVPREFEPPAPPNDARLNLDDAVDSAETAGVRDPERDDIREMGDLAFNMRDYNRQVIALFNEMQDILLDGISEMEAMRARFARMR